MEPGFFLFVLVCGAIPQFIVLAVFRRTRWTLWAITFLSHVVVGYVTLGIIRPFALQWTLVQMLRFHWCLDVAVYLVVILSHVAVLAWLRAHRSHGRSLLLHGSASAVGLAVFSLLYWSMADKELLSFTPVPRAEFPWREVPYVYVLDGDGRVVSDLMNEGRTFTLASPADEVAFDGECRDPRVWCLQARNWDGRAIELLPAPIGPAERSLNDSDLREEGARQWRFTTSKMGWSLVAKSKSLGRVVFMQLATALVRPQIWYLTVLPGDQLVFRWGHEVIAVDWNTRRMAVLGEGRSPAVWPRTGCASPAPSTP